MALKRVASLRRLPWFPMIILGAVVITSLFAPFLTPHSPTAIDLPNRLLPPAWGEGGKPQYLFGTDSLGRDLMTRILYGGRVSLQVASFVLMVSGAIGLALGIVAGYSRGVLDAVIMRTVDGFAAVPGLLVAIMFAVSLGPGMQTLIVAIGFGAWAGKARVLRGQVLSVARRDYVLQAKVAGCSELRIMAVHILPSILSTFMVLLSLSAGGIILTEASLSFLGAGVPPPTASWGQMIAEGKEYITSAWWIALLPGSALALTVLGFNLLGDWLRDYFDPRLRQR